MHLFLNQKQLVSFFLTNHPTENFFLFFGKIMTNEKQ